MMTAREALERTKRVEILDGFSELSKDDIATLRGIERVIRESADEGETQCEVYANWLNEKIRQFLLKCQYNIIEKPPILVVIDWSEK